MNFLRNRTLTQSAAIVLLLVGLVFLVQHFILNGLTNRVDEAERKIEYTRSALQDNHQISLRVQQYLNGETTLGPQIIAKILEQEHRFNVLSNGGRVDGTDFFIKPLSRLPGITLNGLREHWSEYKLGILNLVTTETEPSQPSTNPVPFSATDSITAAFPDTAVTQTSQPHEASIPQTKNNKAKLQYEGLSLALYKWYDQLVIDIEEQVLQAKETETTWRNTFLIMNIILLGGLFYFFYQSVITPLQLLKQNISQHQHTHLGHTEIGEVGKHVNHTIENLKDATDFVTAIGKGDLSINYKDSLDQHYIPGNNRLADSLIEMQSKLRELNEEEQKRQWVNEGLARFVDIMRSSNDNLIDLGDKIISGLVNYTKSNQGALYFLNDEESNNIYLELISLFAFDIKKHEQQKIKPGQGILGQAFLEKETTLLTSLPEEYIRITSGLGDANPTAVLIVPLKVDQDIYGLVELASFQNFKPHEIAFVEKLGETIASTLASVRAAQKNKQLIQQFQQQTEEMRAQEEEMRQNMEELQATQEEIVRKEKNYVARIEELEKIQSSAVDSSELIAIQKTLAEKEKEYIAKISALEKQLSEKPVQEKDWAVAQELGKTLRINLEALKITQEELHRKRST